MYCRSEKQCSLFDTMCVMLKCSYSSSFETTLWTVLKAFSYANESTFCAAGGGNLNDTPCFSRRNPILNCTGVYMFIQVDSFLFPMPLNYCVPVESDGVFANVTIFEHPFPYPEANTAVKPGYF
jgi:hypothetical protein